MGLTTIVLTKNNETIIGDCLNSCVFSDELIVIDDKSQDRTTQIAKNMGAKVYTRPLRDDYSAQRNFGLSKASNEWILFVDSDEFVSKQLANEILEFINSDDKKVNAGVFRRKNYLFGKLLNYGEYGQTKLLRLGRTGKGKWKRNVHEYWQINGPKHYFENPLIHKSESSLSDVITKINKYSALHAQENIKEGKRSNLLKIIMWPTAKFINNYFIHKAYRDGTHGIVSSLLMSFHSFLSWSKLWLTQKK